VGGIGELLDASITGVGMPAKPAPVMDLSKIDFEDVAQSFQGIQARYRRSHILRVGRAVGRLRLE